MRAERLFEALGLVDDRLIEEAADARRAASPWSKWAAMAACLALVLGIGSVSFGMLLRGCGGADGMSQSADCAPADNNASAPAAAGDSGYAGGDSEKSEGEADAPADAPMAPAEPDEAPSADNANDEVIFADSAFGENIKTFAPVLSLSAESEAALSGTRELTLNNHGLQTAVADRYTVTNPTDRDLEVDFTYQTAGSLRWVSPEALTLTADGSVVDTEVSFTSARYDFERDPATNSLAGGWETLRTRGGEPVTMLDLEQTVTVWEIRNVQWDHSLYNVRLKVLFQKPAGTRLLYNGFNDCDVWDGRDCCTSDVSDGVSEPRRELVFLGEAPADWEIQTDFITNGDKLPDDLTCDVTARTMTLGEYLGSLTESDLARDALAELLTQELPSLYDGNLWFALGVNESAYRVFFHSFSLTIPAGETVEITANYTFTGFQWIGSSDQGYAGTVLTGGTGDLELTSQTALLTVEPGTTLLEGDLTPNVRTPLEENRYYYFKIH